MILRTAAPDVNLWEPHLATTLKGNTALSTMHSTTLWLTTCGTQQKHKT